MSRMVVGEGGLARGKRPIKPAGGGKGGGPVKGVGRTGGAGGSLHHATLPPHHQEAGPDVDMASVLVDRPTGIYNLSYHRMEIKGPNLTSMLVVPRQTWKIFKDHEDAGLECPVATVLGHHPAFNMGAAYRGMFEDDEYQMI